MLLYGRLAWGVGGCEEGCFGVLVGYNVIPEGFYVQVFVGY